MWLEHGDRVERGGARVPTSLEEQIWLPSHLLWEFLWMCLPSPECPQGQAPVYRTESHQMVHPVLTPSCLHTPPAEATRGSLVGGGGSVGAASVSASTCPCQPHRKAGVEGMEGELCTGTGMSWERQPNSGPEARTRLCSEQVWRLSPSTHSSSLTETPLSSRPLG